MSASDEALLAPAPPLPAADTPAQSADRTFARCVLNLDDEGAEAALEYKLTTEATRLGLSISPPPQLNTPPPLEDPPTNVSVNASTTPIPAPRRISLANDGRSISTDSVNSGISRLTTDVSRSWDRSSTGLASLQSVNRRSSQASASSRSRDSVLSQPYPVAKSSRNSSLPPGPTRLGAQSPDSIGSPSSPHRNLVRGLSRLRIRRHASDKSVTGCPHCAHTDPVNHEAIHHLPCGHVYCTWALRNLIVFTHAQDPSAWPTCCDQRVPKPLIDLTRGSQERIPMTPRSNTWSENIPRTPSIIEQDDDSTYDKITTVAESGTQSPVSPINEEDNVILAEANLEKALDLPAFVEMRKKHEQQRNRLLRWDAKHKAELIATRTKRRKATLLDHEQQSVALEERHTITVADVEDKHISAEAGLRTAQDLERANNLTALKHMEAFCRGVSLAGEPHNRAVSEQDMRELAKTQRLRDTMDVRHESAINVLRGEQNQRVRNRQRRHEAAVDALLVKGEKEVERVQAEMDSELRTWEAVVEHKKTLLERWWGIETRVLLKERGEEVDLGQEDKLPPLRWVRSNDGDGVGLGINGMTNGIGKALEGRSKEMETHAGARAA